MDQQLNYISKLNLIKKGVVKASFNRTSLVNIIRPETEWSNHEQVENFLIKIGGPNPRM